MCQLHVNFASSLMERAKFDPEFKNRLDGLDRVLKVYPLIGRACVEDIRSIRALNWKGQQWMYVWLPLADFLPEAEEDEILVFDCCIPWREGVRKPSAQEKQDLLAELKKLYEAVEA
jgi:hypothetical protein